MNRSARWAEIGRDPLWLPSGLIFENYTRAWDVGNFSTTVRNSGLLVAVTVAGSGALSDVKYDKRWLVNAHEYNIGRETTEAFEAAYRRAGEQAVTDLLRQGPFGAALAVAQDPTELARRMRLRND